MNWNSYYTQKKQKEMVKKAIEEDNKNTPPTLKPLYRNLYTGSSKARYEKQRKEKIAWRIGSAIIFGVVVFMSWIIYLAASS